MKTFEKNDVFLLMELIYIDNYFIVNSLIVNILFEFECFDFS
jgi:hypothetical protein